MKKASKTARMISIGILILYFIAGIIFVYRNYTLGFSMGEVMIFAAITTVLGLFSGDQIIRKDTAPNILVLADITLVLAIIVFAGWMTIALPAVKQFFVLP